MFYCFIFFNPFFCCIHIYSFKNLSFYPIPNLSPRILKIVSTSISNSFRFNSVKFDGIKIICQFYSLIYRYCIIQLLIYILTPSVHIPTQKIGIANGYDYADTQDDSSLVKFCSSTTATPVSVYKETPLVLPQF